MTVLRYSIIGILFFFFGSCQKEEETIVQDNTESFVRDSPLAALLSRTSQNPTSVDNVLDNSSCFSVQLPVTVIVNTQQITVTDEADYDLVQQAIEAFSNDDDLVNFVYPITIRFQNFQTQIIQDNDELEEVLEDCDEDNGFDEIDCISLVYPITISLYDSNNQLANTITITSNSSFFSFLANMPANVYAAINYPISVVNSNGQTIVVISNTELEQFIEDSIDDCDDSPGGGNPITTLSQIMTNGSWHVYYCYYEGTDETNDYQGYQFTFNSNENVVVQRNTTFIDGDWDLDDDNGHQRLSLNFDGSALHDIETNWRVIEFSETIIRLKKQNSSNTDYLTFKKN